MDPVARKTALRMIPYGLYVLTGETRDGRFSAATVNWATQASFEPPLIAVGVKADSSAHAIIKEAGSFALIETVERGDHSIFVGEVIDAGAPADLEGRPDAATLVLRDLGESTFYGG